MIASTARATLFNRRHFTLATLLGASAPASLWAVTPGGLTTPELEGTTADGQRLQLAGLRGRVVLVFYWSTGCAVCRDKMRELRANLKGWQDAPFTLFGVNMDERRQDWLDYERLVVQSVQGNQRFASVWAGGADYRDTMDRPTQLPSACVIDKDGRLVDQYRGRVPAQAWDRIADLI
ncbi:MAG: TlpA disulfide reductase family protein [Pseudomonadota bacterium]